MTATARLATNLKSLITTLWAGNQTSFAKAAGVSNGWLSDLMSERYNRIEMDRLDIVARHLSCDVAYLFYPPEIIWRDLARHTSRDTTASSQQTEGAHVQIPSQQEDIPTEQDLIDAADHLIVLLERFRLARCGSQSLEPQESESRQGLRDSGAPAPHKALSAKRSKAR